MHLAVLTQKRRAAVPQQASSSQSGFIFTSDWPDAVLDDLRKEGDERWDGLIRTMDRRTFERVLGLDLRNCEPPPGDLPPAVLRFFQETGTLPAWAEPERLERAQELFSRHGLAIVTALLCASLPECYAAIKGASTLGLSSKLKTRPEERIMQTAQFVLDVMAPGGLGAQGRGIRRTQQVRLLHVVLRHGFARHEGYRPEWGVPVNQEDLLGTLMSFSSVILDALPRLGIDLTAQEEEDYLHCWHVVGHVLGVRADQLPGSPAAARALVRRIRERHFAKARGENPAGEELTASLIRSLQDKLPLQLFDGYVPGLVRYLAGDQVADTLGVPPGDWTRTFLGVGRAIARVGDLLGDRSLVCRLSAQWLGRRVLVLTHTLDSVGMPAHFTVPAALTRSWRLRQGAAAVKQSRSRAP